MHFRPLFRHPFTDIRRTIPELNSVGFADSKEFHGFPVDKKNVSEIDGKVPRFLFQHASKHLDMFPGNAAAYEQHHETFRAIDSIDPAAHRHELGGCKSPAISRLMKIKGKGRWDAAKAA